MSLIKIFANKIELDTVKETLTITKENNALINDFKVSYSNFPFLILENKKTVQALGPRDVSAVNKPKTVQVVIEELGQKYQGEIQILSYLKGFRKVSLKYGTELLSIMERPIAGFMPTLSVKPFETNPVTFTEESSEVVPGYNGWPSHVAFIIGESYPAVKYNFPTMYWRNKFGVDLQPDDPWVTYRQHINYFNENNFYPVNSYESNPLTTNHINVPAPQVYLLSPMFYALESLGWTMEGDFTNDEFIKKILILSTKNNLCKTTVKNNSVEIGFPNPPIWQNTWSTVTFENTRFVDHSYMIPSDGTYQFDWSFEITDLSGLSKIHVYFSDGKNDSVVLFYNQNNVLNRIVKGTTQFTATAGTVVSIGYCDAQEHAPISTKLEFTRLDQAKEFHQFHPTIELGRYVPDWTFGSYLNEIKNFFNLKIDIDEVRKKISLNFNEQAIVYGEKEILNKSLAFENHDQAAYRAFHLKYQNDIDPSLWITRAETKLYTNQVDDFSNKLETKFKFVPNNGYTAELSEDLDGKDGVGLMIYNSQNAPYIATAYAGQSLEITGSSGIYANYFKKFLKFRLNASLVEMRGFFTETELSRIKDKQRIYVDFQDYLIASLEYSETPQDNFDALLKLESINF